MGYPSTTTNIPQDQYKDTYNDDIVEILSGESDQDQSQEETNDQEEDDENEDEDEDEDEENEESNGEEEDSGIEDDYQSQGQSYMKPSLINSYMRHDPNERPEADYSNDDEEDEEDENEDEQNIHSEPVELSEEELEREESHENEIDYSEEELEEKTESDEELLEEEDKYSDEVDTTEMDAQTGNTTSVIVVHAEDNEGGDEQEAADEQNMDPQQNMGYNFSSIADLASIALSALGQNVLTENTEENQAQDDSQIDNEDSHLDSEILYTATDIMTETVADSEKTAPTEATTTEINETVTKPAKAAPVRRPPVIKREPSPPPPRVFQSNVLSASILSLLEGSLDHHSKQEVVESSVDNNDSDRLLNFTIPEKKKHVPHENITPEIEDTENESIEKSDKIENTELDSQMNDIVEDKKIEHEKIEEIEQQPVAILEEPSMDVPVEAVEQPAEAAEEPVELPVEQPVELPVEQHVDAPSQIPLKLRM
ncbi:unnamed protein product [[Candida] boidinii]|nr:unnamed protein product [[Candida] boidinii]